MVQADSDRVPRAPSYSGSHSFQFRFRLQGLHLVPLSFQSHSSISAFFFCGPTTPARCRFRLLQFRSPLLSESLLFSSPPGTKMFQFPGLSSLRLCIYLRMPCSFLHGGFPHSDTCASLTVYVSTQRFAVFCVLLLLYMPRHPPYALYCLITFRHIREFFVYGLFRELLTISF